jgi:hypothetical protein
VNAPICICSNRQYAAAAAVRHLRSLYRGIEAKIAAVGGFWQAQFSKRYQSSLIFVPESERGASQALQECDSPDECELWVIAQDLPKTIERDTAGKMVHMMRADIACEPS